MKRNSKMQAAIGVTLCLLTVTSIPALAAPGGGMGERGGFPAQSISQEQREMAFSSDNFKVNNVNMTLPELPEGEEGFGKAGRGMMGFNSLVEEGVISQETADNMAEYMRGQMEARRAEMTEGERQVQFEQGKENRDDMFEEMVNSGIITQEEADAIKASMPEAPGATDADQRQEVPEGEIGLRKAGRGMMDCSKLVEDGVISQETADNIAKYMLEQMEARKTKMENMAEGERQVQFGRVDMKTTDMFDAMVSAGIITQEEAAAIKASMPQPPAREV